MDCQYCIDFNKQTKERKKPKKTLQQIFEIKKSNKNKSKSKNKSKKKY